MKIVPYTLFILLLLLSPTVIASDETIAITTTTRGSIGVSIVNTGNDSINYSFQVIYARYVLTKVLPNVISDSGIVAANDSIMNWYPLNYRFAKVVAELETDDTKLICFGYVVFNKVKLFIAQVERPACS